MSKRIFSDSVVISPSKLTKYFHDEEANVIILDQQIGSEWLNMKMYCDSFLVGLLSSEEFRELVEHFGQQIVVDKCIQQQLRRVMGKNVWGKHLQKYLNAKCSIKGSGMENNKLFVLDCILHRDNYAHLTKELQNDSEIIEKMLSLNDWFFTNNLELLENKKLAMAVVQRFSNNFFLFYSVVKKWCHDKEFMMHALKQCELQMIQENFDELYFYFVEMSPKEFKDDPEYMLECYKRDLLDANSDYVDHEWDVLVADYKQKIYEEQFKAKEINYLNADKDELIKGICSGKLSIFHQAIQDNTKDKDILLALLRAGCDIFQYLGDDNLRTDREFLMEVAKGKVMPEFVFKYMPDVLKSDKELMLEAMKANKEAVKYIYGELKNEKELILIALRTNHSACIPLFSDELRNDRSFILEAVKCCGEVLLFSSFRHDKEIAIEAVKQNGQLWEYLPFDLRENKDILFSAISKRPDVIAKFPALSENKDFISHAIEINSSAFLFASDVLRGDKELVLKAVKCGLLSHKNIDYGIFEEFLYETIALDLRAIAPRLYGTDDIAQLVTINLQNKLSGNQKFCKYILSCLDMTNVQN